MKEEPKAEALTPRDLWRVAGAALVSFPRKNGKRGVSGIAKPRKVIVVERMRPGVRKEMGRSNGCKGRGRPSSKHDRPRLHRKKEEDNDDHEASVEVEDVPFEPPEPSDPFDLSTPVTADFHSLFKRKRALRENDANARHVRANTIRAYGACEVDPPSSL